MFKKVTKSMTLILILRFKNYGGSGRLTLSLIRTLQTLEIDPSPAIHLFGHEIESLVHRLRALVNAKLSSPNGAFASLTEICLVNLSVNFKVRWGILKQDALDPWLWGLRRLCEDAKVKIHVNEGNSSTGGPSGDCFPCSSRRTDEICGIDSAPVEPEEGD